MEYWRSYFNSILQPKEKPNVTYSGPKVTYGDPSMTYYPKVTSSGTKVTYSGYKVTYRYPIPILTLKICTLALR